MSAAYRKSVMHTMNLIIPNNRNCHGRHKMNLTGRSAIVTRLSWTGHYDHLIHSFWVCFFLSWSRYQIDPNLLFKNSHGVDIVIPVDESGSFWGTNRHCVNWGFARILFDYNAVYTLIVINKIYQTYFLSLKVLLNVIANHKCSDFTLFSYCLTYFGKWRYDIKFFC